MECLRWGMRERAIWSWFCWTVFTLLLSACGGGENPTSRLEPAAQSPSMQAVVARHVISWQPETTRLQSAAGLHLSVQVTLAVSQASSTPVVIEPNAGLAGVISVKDGQRPSLPVGTTKVQLVVNVPDGTAPGTTFQGTLQVHPKGANNVLAKPLPLMITVVAPPFPTARVTGRVDPATPHAQDIVRVLSVVDAAAPGAPLTVPVIPNQQPILMGVSGDGTPWLAAVGTGDQVLGVESTAVAFVRLTMGNLSTPPGQNGNQVNALIRAASSFPALKAAIAAALYAHTPPMQVAAVSTTVGAVLQEVQSQVVISGMSGVQRAKVVVDEVANLPYKFIDDGATNTLWVDEDAGKPGVLVKNRTFLAWQIDSKSDAGAMLFSGVSNPLNLTWTTLLAYYGGTETSLTVAGAGSFTVKMSQSDTTRKQNATSLVRNSVASIVSTAMAVLPADDSTTVKCTIAIVSAMLNSPQFDAAVAQGSSSAVIDYMKSWFSIQNIFTVVNDCALASGPDGASASMVLGYLDVASVRTVQKIWTALNLARTLNTTASVYWQFLSQSDVVKAVHLCKVNGLVVVCPQPVLSIPPFAEGQQLTTIVGLRNWFSSSITPKPACSSESWSAAGGIGLPAAGYGIVDALTAGTAALSVTSVFERYLGQAPPSLLTSTLQIRVSGDQHLWVGMAEAADIVIRPDTVYRSDGTVFKVLSTAIDPQSSLPDPNVITLWRYIKNATHFWTAFPDVENLGGYRLEGAAGFVYRDQVPGSIPVYRFLNPATGVHYWGTAAPNQPGFASEGVAFFALPTGSADPRGVSMVRLSCPRCLTAFDAQLPLVNLPPLPATCPP